VAPLLKKLFVNFPYGDWCTALHGLNPKTLRCKLPALDMQVGERADGLKKVRFANEHEFWLPEAVALNAMLWHEYLSVFWHHAGNGHYYFRSGVDISSGEVVVDVGACEGFFVRMALLKGAERVVGVKPSAIMQECLERTFAKEIKTGQVNLIRAALGAARGEVFFTAAPDNPFAGSMSADLPQKTSVPLFCLDDLFSGQGIDCVDFIKMDIEGAEFQALDGAEKIIRRHHPKLAVTMYHRPYDYQTIRCLLRYYGYRQINSYGVTEWDGEYWPQMLHARW
jgi:FkbM family methyltransferase